MANESAFVGTGETAVSDEENIFCQSISQQQFQWRKHFSHARAAFGSFVTDDDDISFFNFIVVYGLGQVFFAVVYFGRTFKGMMLYGDGCGFADAGKGRQIAFDNSQSSVGADRVFQRMDDLRTQDAASFRFSSMVFPVTVRASP